tara:strand:+ start:2061 stop:2636 length:576 start_codon:yes stop_codon:yes gene_type:complete
LAKKSIIISRNFDFNKLDKELPKVLETGMRRLGRSAAKGAKEKIDKGLSPRLAHSTLQLRKERGTGGTKPLFETGNLYRSIKATDDGGVEMLHYGFLHEKGYKVPNVPLGYERKTGARSGVMTVQDFSKDSSPKGFNWKQSKPIFHPTKKIPADVPARPFITPSDKEILEPAKKIHMDILKALSIPNKELT